MLFPHRKSQQPMMIIENRKYTMVDQNADNAAELRPKAHEETVTFLYSPTFASGTPHLCLSTSYPRRPRTWCGHLLQLRLILPTRGVLFFLLSVHVSLHAAR